MVSFRAWLQKMDKTASSYVKAFLVLLFMVCMFAIRQTKDYLKHVLLGTPKQPAVLTVRDKEAIHEELACYWISQGFYSITSTCP